MEENLESNKITAFLLEEDEKITDLRDKTNFHVLELKIENINQSREWFKHLTIISISVLGALLLFQNSETNYKYLIIGIGLNLFLIVFILSYLKGILDKEGIELEKTMDKYTSIAESKVNIIAEYLKKPNLRESDIQQYFIDLKNNDTIVKLNNEIEQENKKREARDQQPLDYTGEFVILIFIVGLFFIVLALIPNILLGQKNIIIIIFIFILMAFFNPQFLVMKLINKMCNFIRFKYKRFKK